MIELGQGVLQQGIGALVFHLHACDIVLPRQARGLEGADQLRAQFRPQIGLAAALPTSKQLQQREVNMLGGDRLHGGALQVMARLAGGHTLQITGRARVLTQCQLQAVALELFGVQRQQLLENTELERQKLGAKQMRIESKQLFQHGLDRWRASWLAGWFARRCRLRRWRGNRVLGGCV